MPIKIAALFGYLCACACQEFGFPMLLCFISPHVSSTLEPTVHQYSTSICMFLDYDVQVPGDFTILF